MKYGYFDDSAKEYVITTPKTPLPWINYLGTEGFYSLISNTAGGYSFYKDAKLMRITRYRYNNVPADTGGRMYYIKDCKSKHVFSPAFFPAKTELKNYTCRHGLGYSVFSTVKYSLQCEMTCFVPLHDSCEINYIVLKNNSDKPKKLQLYSAAEWCLWNAVDDATNFQRNLNIGEVEVENSVIYHKTEYRERRNHYAFFSVNSKIDGFDTDRDTFLGQFNGWDSPDQVKNSSSGNTTAGGRSPIASHRIDFTLNSGESKSFIFILGYCENDENEKFISDGTINKRKAYELIEKYNNDDKVINALYDLKRYWNNLLLVLKVKTPSAELDRNVNIWNQYQCIVTYNFSRSASYYESGIGRGMGFRDSCQDLLGCVHLIPEKSRERILDLASIQFEDGSTYHQYQPLTKRGNADIGSGFNDDPLWLIACVCAYIKETGDFTILQTPVPFNNKIGSEKPLLEHLKKSVNFTIDNKDPHGLPLIGRADWNDCLNLNCFSKTPGESFQTCSNYDSKKAESVFIAAMFVLYANEYSVLCKRIGLFEEADRVLSEVNKMKDTVINYGWDGNWYLRAYDAFGNKIGSRENGEGKIYIEPQGFCVMADIGDKPMQKSALQSVDKYLECDYGAELLYPPYSKYHEELGEISSYPMGNKENGSVFCHNNTWIIIANAMLDNGDKAFELLSKICPAFLEDKSEIRKTEPYVYSQTVAGRKAGNYGQAKNSWLTGTASWAMVAVSQYIIGVQPDYDGLKILPCLPSFINKIIVKRIFRGVIYNITVIKDGKNYTKINGRIINNNFIPMQNKESEIIVHI